MNETRASRSVAGRPSSRLLLPLLVTVAVALLLSGLSLVGISPRAEAAGPAYDGPNTEATGPAFFGPAPNPFPYCENPTYFDPFPENVNPMGRIDVTGAPNASVTTNGVDLTFELTAEGETDGQYPGFFPGGGEGSPGDQPKGIEMQFSDAAEIRLSEPLFYTQWVFTDVDQENEGFFVTPQWSGAPAQVAVFGGDAAFTFAGDTTTVSFNDGDAPNSHPSEAIEGRVQVDLLGASTGLDVLRDVGSGQSGFAVGGGCEPIGVAKELTAGPTWNGTSFDVTYTISVRNNLPSAATIAADIAAAELAAASSFKTGDPLGINMTDLTLTDLLTNDAFTAVNVISNTNTAGDITANQAYDGDADTSIIEAGQVIGPETEATFELVLQYVPEITGPLGPDCTAVYDLTNQATVGGSADGVDVVDLSDDGVNPDPGADNGAGEVDDPTLVQFDCPPEQADPALQIVKTVVAAGTPCPAFADGTSGDGDALAVASGDTVTYCITVNNPSTVDLTMVEVSDPMAAGDPGFDGAVGDLPAGEEATVSFDLVVDASTPVQNTATANAVGPDDVALDPVTDTALIELPDAPPPPVDPVLEIVKTVVAAGTPCPAFADGVGGDGDALSVQPGDTVTYCITVNNASDTDATNVLVADQMAPADFNGAIGDLAGRAEATVMFDLVVDTATPPQNTASATGTGPNGDLDPVVDTAIITVDANPDVTLIKTVLDGADADCSTAVEGQDEVVLGVTGDPITWCFVATNTGNVALTNVIFNDGPAGITGRNLLADATPPVLPVGESVSFSLNSTIADDGLVNVATVEGDPSDSVGNVLPGIPPVEDQNDAAVNEASVDLAKTVVAGTDADCATAVELVTVNAGTAVTYCFEVSNTGSVPLRVTEVVDVTLGVTVPLSAAQQDIAPGASVTVSLSAIAEGDIQNTAEIDAIVLNPVTGEPEPGVDPLEVDDPAEVVALEANLSIVKRDNTRETNSAGSVLPYWLVVSNAGPDEAVNVVVVDTLPPFTTVSQLPDVPGWTCSATDTTITCTKATPLSPGESAELQYWLQVADDAPAGINLVNVATVTSDTPDPDPSDNEDTETTRVTPPDAVISTTQLPPPTITNPPPPVVLPTAAPPVPAAPPLAVTGVYSSWLAFAAAAMTATGGVFFVSGRRRSRDYR